MGSFTYDAIGFGGGDPVGLELEVSKGRVSSHSSHALVGINPAVGATFEDLWGAGGVMTLAAVSESWEVVSDDSNDNATGTGARTILVPSFDDTYTQQVPQIVTMNGNTPVALTGTHFRPDNIRRVVVLTKGTATTNIGTITVRVAGGGDIRGVITPGTGISADGQMTVPAGKCFFALNELPFYPKDADGEIQTMISPFGTDRAKLSTGAVAFYQTPIVINFRQNFPITEKTDFALQAKATNPGSRIATILEYMLIDKIEINQSLMSLTFI